MKASWARRRSSTSPWREGLRGEGRQSQLAARFRADYREIDMAGVDFP